MPLTCSEVMVTEEAHICSFDGALIVTGRNYCLPCCTRSKRGRLISKLQRARLLAISTGAGRWRFFRAVWTLPTSRAPNGEDGFASLNMRSPCEQWELAGPRFTRISPDGAADCWQALDEQSLCRDF